MGSRLVVALVAAALAVGPARAQGDLSARCAGAPPGEPRTICLAVAQTVESAQPQIGMLIAGGVPVLGSASPAGLRLGATPRLDLSGRLNLVFVRLPDILTAEAGATAQRLNQQFGVPAPALAGSAAVGVFPGVDATPGIGGIGSVDALASAAWLPFQALGTEGFKVEAPRAAWGVGARVGILRETFTVPGVSVSLMYRGLGWVAFGDVCQGTEIDIPEIEESRCPAPGDAGEFGFDLRSWSTRVAVGKRLAGIGLLGGLGYDRYASEVAYAFRYPDPLLPSSGLVSRPPVVELRSSRWSVFGSLSYTFLLTSLVVEAGWQQGASTIPGFSEQSRFDPRGGAFFGSAGVRLSI